MGRRAGAAAVLCITLAACIILSCGGEGRDAGEGNGAGGPDAGEVSPFAAADSAAESVKVCSYGFRLYGTGSLAGEPSLVGELAGRVREDSDHPLLRIEMGYDSLPDDDIEPARSLLLISGTDSVYAYNLADGILEKGALHEGGGDLLRPAAYAIMNEFFIHGPFMDEMAAASVSGRGTETIHGVECRGWLVEYSGGSMAEWTLGTLDHLPRRVERMMTDREGNQVSVVLEISGLQVNGDIDDALFEPDFPAVSEVITYSAFLPVGTEAPGWTLFGSDGAAVSLYDLRGSVVVLDFWATWCGPCLNVMPSIQAVHEAYSGDGVEVFGVNVWENGDPAAFMEENGFSYGMLMEGDDVAEDYRVSGIPTMYVVDRNGRVAFVEVGANPEIGELLAAVLDSLTTVRR